MIPVSLGPELRWSDWVVKAVCVQHLQQQVIQRHFVLALHAVEVLHAFVTAGNINKVEARS